MDEHVATAQEIQERTVPDCASVAAMVAMAMRMRLGWKPKRLHASSIHVGVTSAQPLVSASTISLAVACHHHGSPWLGPR